jgi:subtilisin family serine protease
MYKEYVVTAPNLETTDSLWDDLVKDGSTSETIPERSVEVADERPINKKNTTYLLTKEEAELLKQDPRVIDVFDISEFAVGKFAFQEGNFNKNTTTTGEKQNWGLLRHILETNTFGTSVDDPGGTYNYVLDGTGVDVVIIDSGIQADHPEFQDSSGASRVKQINWFTASGVGGTMPTAHYTDYDGHGTHVAATVAGKTFGWAKNADIYSIKLEGLQGASDPNSGISYSNAFDCILGWHLAKTNGRPTILNNSWGFIVYWETAGTDFLTFDGVTTYPVTGGVYRGTAWSAALKDTSKGLIGQQINDTKYKFPYKITSVDTDVEGLINAGIVVCSSAGNSGMKHDVLGGTDYNNYITATGLSNYYYHRGSSPHSGSNPGIEVGSTGLDFVSSTEAKSTYSDTGPGVDIYAAGDRIISAMSNVNAYGSNSSYYIDSNYKQHLLSGTSMASPQVAGMCALVKQVHPDWTPYQVKGWMVDNAKNVLYSTGENNDYTVSASILGGVQKMAYMPMSGQLVYRISEV